MTGGRVAAACLVVKKRTKAGGGVIASGFVEIHRKKARRSVVVAGCGEKQSMITERSGGGTSAREAEEGVFSFSGTAAIITSVRRRMTAFMFCNDPKQRIKTRMRNCGI